MNSSSKNKLESSLKSLAKTSFIVLIGLILSKILLYTYRIIIARYFGPEEYGLFSLALMILGFFVTISSLGLNEGLLRYVALYRGKKEINKINYIFRISLAILALSSLFFTILLFSSSNFISLKIFHNQNLSIYLKIFSILISITSFSNLFLFIIKAYEKINWYSFIMNILQNVLKVLALILFIFLGIKSNAVAISYFLGILGMLIVSYIFCRYKLSEIFAKPVLKKAQKRELIINLFSYSWPIIFLGVFSSIFLWLDSFSIGYFKSVLEVGFYNAALPIAALLGVASEIFMQLFFPLITKEYSRKNFELIKKLSKQVGKWIFMINLPIFLIMILFPGVIINILFGKEYLIAENSLRLLAVGAFSFGVLNISSSLLAMSGRSKLILFDIVVFSTINFVLNILLVPIWGINGAAFSTMFCTIFLGITFILQSNHYLSITPLQTKMKKTFLVSLIPLTIILIIKKFVIINILTLALIGILFLAVYLLLIYLTGCFDKSDLVIINAIKRKIFKI